MYTCYVILYISHATNGCSYSIMMYHVIVLQAYCNNVKRRSQTTTTYDDESVSEESPAAVNRAAIGTAMAPPALGPPW